MTKLDALHRWYLPIIHLTPATTICWRM